MKRAIVFITVFFIGVTCYAQQAVVAVAPFEARSGISASDAETITEIFSVQLSEKRTVTVVTRAALGKVMQEHGFQTGDWSNDSKIAELGRALNANAVVRGQVQKLGSSIVVTVSILDIKTLQVMSGATMRLATIDEVFDKMDGFVMQTSQTMANARTDYKIGDRGPGGGIIFYAEGGVFMECSQTLGAYSWKEAIEIAKNYNGGGYKDWHLSTLEELTLMYKNLKLKNLGGFDDGDYWSSSAHDTGYFRTMNFRKGDESWSYQALTISVRAVRAF
ncbi:MAG: DUF1566 domain-containing protein [Spirochaetaceae bacterium]|jgi:TolB-like protein|nr:DUF1566 domain-containing protein [Spirochaetaceae bacterium]